MPLGGSLRSNARTTFGKVTDRSGFSWPSHISYRGLKLPRVSAGLGRLLPAAQGRFAAGWPSLLIIGRQGCGTIANARSWLLLRRDDSKSHLRDLCRLIYADGRRRERSPAFGEENRCRSLQLCGSPG